MKRTDFDEPVERRGTHCVKWDEEPAPDIIPLWVADMDFKAAPAIIEALRRRVEHGVFAYELVPEEYYTAVASWFHRRHGWKIERKWIQYTTGVVPALSACIKAITRPGDGVILQTPVYNCFFSSVRNNGCQAIENRLLIDGKGRYTIDFDDLERCAAREEAKVLVLCNPHNPACRVWTRGELGRVAEICRRHGVVVISDEIHNELTFNGLRYVPFGTVDMDNAIVCCSPSKSFNIAGLQTANIVCSREEWRTKIDRAINDNEVCDLNPFGVEALIAAYNDSEAWLDQLCQYIYGNYEALLDFVSRNMPYVSVTPLEGTYLAWVDVSRLPLNCGELCEKLLEEGRVHVNPGTMYGIDDAVRGNAGEGFIRINMACRREILMEALQRMERVMTPLAL